MLYIGSMDKELARKLYLQGMSTREVATQIGSDSGNVYRAIADIARTRVRPESKHWRTSRNRARRLMETHLGRKLNRLEHVHHIDGDFTNNVLANLEVKSASEHLSHHHDRGMGSRSNPKRYKLEDYRRHKSQRDSKTKEWRAKNPERFAAMRLRAKIKRQEKNRSSRGEH